MKIARRGSFVKGRFVPPRAPETSNYWPRFANVIAVAIAAALLMAIGSLGYSIVKDHAQ